MQEELQQLQARLTEEERRAGAQGPISVSLAKSIVATLEAQARELAELKKTMSWARKRM